MLIDFFKSFHPKQNVNKTKKRGLIESKKQVIEDNKRTANKKLDDERH